MSRKEALDFATEIMGQIKPSIKGILLFKVS